ncbi:MAG: hypothetical protein ACI8RZ_001787 [Myxococcota bacterium]|jgi:hypothetical protein
MSGKHTSRRRFLRGAFAGGGLVTVGLPALEIFAPRSAHAADSLFPQRFGLFFWGNGNRPDQWTPTGEGADWAVSEELAPLANLTDVISVISGMSVKVDNISPHWSGAAGLLTGQQVDGDDDDWTVAGPTIDQIIAAEIGDSTLYRSLEIGISSSGIFSFTGPNATNPAETDPFAFYERIFGETFRGPGEGGVVDPSLGYRRSVLDAVLSDVNEMQSQLGSNDRQRLEQHLDGIRELELRLARLSEDPPDLAACMAPKTPLEAYPDIDGRAQLSAKSRAMSDMLAMALACDQTRVFSFHFTPPLNNELFTDTSDGHHNLTHNESGDQPEVHSITVQVMEELAYLLEALRAVPEGEGSLLDNSIVLAASETSEGRTHALDEIPLIVAGGAGRIAMGQHYRSYTQESASKVMLSLIRAMDVPAASFGAGESEATDGLSDIEV